GNHRHCEIALQIRQAVLLRLARQIVARSRMTRSDAFGEQASARERTRLGIHHSRERLTAIAPRGERNRLVRGIDEVYVGERAAGRVRGLIDYAAHDRGLVEAFGLLEQIDQELELPLVGALDD